MHTLTFDIEEWYHANYDHLGTISECPETHLADNIQYLLDLCDRYGLRSTCFILGCVAENKPELIREINRRGHEVASHGYGHRQVFSMTPAEFDADLSRSIKTLEDAAGTSIRSFRAPSWSINLDILTWYYDILEKHGIQLSSSILPAQTFLYGIPGFPPKPHHPVVNGRRVNVLEHPVPVTSVFGKKIAFSGGFYFRFFPLWFICRQFKRQLHEGNAPFVYLHPREIDPAQPRLSLKGREHFIHYHGINTAPAKFERLCAFLGKLEL